MKWLNKIKSIFTQEEQDDKNVKMGSIKFFNRRRGYGFIRSRQTTKDVFVHASELEDRVRKGDRVQFELTISDKGLEARNVHLVNAS